MKIFGTDGIRGAVNVYPITPAFFVKLGNAIGYKIYNKAKILGTQKPRIIIGKDTRLSGYMIESALLSGLVSSGVDVILTGPLPTPAISMLTISMRADAAIMITASHNPFYDNGVKIFNNLGSKISKQEQDEIELLLKEEDISKFLVNSIDFGKARRVDDVVGRYIEFVKSTFPKNIDLKGIKIAIDCANGAAYKIAPEIFWELGANVVSFNTNPNGININLDCGSTHKEVISAKVKECGADIGISLDGDADRILISDENGEIIDGNHIIGIIAKSFLSKGLLKSKTVVSTIIANMGLEVYLNSIGLELLRTKVGDSFVSQVMSETHCNLGGEPSGHIIINDYCKTGDAIIASLQVLAVMMESKIKASQLSKIFTKTDNLEENLPLKNLSFNESLIAPAIDNIIKQFANAKLNIVVRKSGTENILRFFVDGNLPKKDLEFIMLELKNRILGI
jgi:phosphoglucosamine mutase